MLSEPWHEREVMYVSYVGNLFLRMLKALILPLIVPSLIAAVGSLDMSISGKVGGRAVGYYMATTVLAVILGKATGNILSILTEYLEMVFCYIICKTF